MRKKKQKKSRLPQIVGLTVLFILLFIGWSMLGPQPEIPKPLTQAADDFIKNPKIKNVIDLTGNQAKTVTGKVGDAAKAAGKALDGSALPDKAGKLADSAAKGTDKLGKQMKQGGDSALVKVSTVWHVEETVNSLRSDPDWVSLQKIPDHTRKALLAIEDHDFYKHGALDITGIARAAFVNLRAGEVQQGGSTLTQQMVKNVFLSSEQTIARKAEEAVLATWVERKYSKDEVLEMYFNTTYFGAGAYGIRNASKKFFGKEPSQLTLPESAMLAAMPYAPSALNPYENPGGCAKRVRLVLKEMLKYGYIGNTELTDALAKGVTLKNGRTLLLE
ncbi:MAG: transglycosylase domain-containing protein [Acidaminococcaceae bacterium]|nr:transglycosylase domain-containing protein [Acidaminococcaceae bacterium]